MLQKVKAALPSHTLTHRHTLLKSRIIATKVRTLMLEKSKKKKAANLKILRKEASIETVFTWQ